MSIHPSIHPSVPFLLPPAPKTKKPTNQPRHKTHPRSRTRPPPAPRPPHLHSAFIKGVVVLLVDVVEAKLLQLREHGGFALVARPQVDVRVVIGGAEFVALCVCVCVCVCFVCLFGGGGGGGGGGMVVRRCDGKKGIEIIDADIRGGWGSEEEEDNNDNPQTQHLRRETRVFFKRPYATPQTQTHRHGVKRQRGPLVEELLQPEKVVWEGRLHERDDDAGEVDVGHHL
jgi:hypothetical protein